MDSRDIYLALNYTLQGIRVVTLYLRKAFLDSILIFHTSVIKSVVVADGSCIAYCAKIRPRHPLFYLID